MITLDQIKHIAKLARLGLREDEIIKFQKDLSLILDYIEKLKEIDISNIEPTSHSIKVENVIRKDELKDEDIETKNQLIEMAPNKKNRYIKVRSIL